MVTSTYASAPGSASTAVTGADPSWARLYRIGGVCAGVFVVMVTAGIVLAVAAPAAPTEGGEATLAHIAAHRSLYVVQQQLWLVPGVFAAVVYLSLFPALKHLDRSLAALGTAIGGGAWALTLTIPTTTTGAPALVHLSDQFAVAGPARRLALATAAETLIAQNRTTSVVGPLTTVGLLLVSVVMLRGVFPRWVAWLGVVAGVLGIAAEALRTVVEGFYVVYGVLLPIWMAAVAWHLYRLGRQRVVKT
ncbi:hypothetical protein ASE25_00035 [Terrabacter sp. Root85]|uniref:DUF4386 family protein n=1 Tax=Terrabacter sp. Root85 TaxID=1736603 RepID=UPI0006FED170|nr:DUF4386 family protein [Terrabacter sp. Root85]KRC91829.1 hypothetical protein ASE25_00035 [Terrabacter sp. Root85]